MMKTRRILLFFALGAFASLVLGIAAVWLGSLNHDEGWYLYAANLVNEGKMCCYNYFLCRNFSVICNGSIWCKFQSYKKSFIMATHRTFGFNIIFVLFIHNLALL